MIFLSIGSNLSSEFGDKITNIRKTIENLKKSNIQVIKCSSFYETPSYPDKNNPKFFNIIVKIKYEKKPELLLEKILLIEKKMGRIRKKKNEPRICDIDIISFNKLIVNSDQLKIPHPSTHNRNFVLFPLKEICPNWTHPITNENIDILIKNLSHSARNEITRMNESDILL